MAKANNTPNVDDIAKAPEGLPAAADVDWHQRYDQLYERFIKVSDEKSETDADNARLKAEAQTRTELDKLIKPFSDRTFIFMCAYCVFVGLVLVARGVGKLDISDGVLNILTGSTAVTVLGLMGMVLTGVFVGARRR